METMYYTPTKAERIADLQSEVNRELPYNKRRLDLFTDKEVRIFYLKRMDYYYNLIIVYKLTNPLMSL